MSRNGTAVYWSWSAGSRSIRRTRTRETMSRMVLRLRSLVLYMLPINSIERLLASF